MDSISEVFLFSEPLTLGQKVRIARIAKRWTQADLAYASGVQQGYVSALERDLKVYPRAKKRILSALGMVDDGPEAK